MNNGYLDGEGRVQDKFDPKNPHFVLALPDEWAHMRSQIVDELNKYVFKNRVVNSRDRRNLELRKNVTLDPTFRALWKKISQKTRYRVTFDTDELVKKRRKLSWRCPKSTNHGSQQPSTARICPKQVLRANKSQVVSGM